MYTRNTNNSMNFNQLFWGIFMERRSVTRLSDRDFRYQWISQAAYYKSESRNVTHEMEADDWFFAEQEFAKMLIMRYLTIANEDGIMTVLGLQHLAKSVGVANPEKLTQIADLIRAIQKISKTVPCFHLEPEAPCDKTKSCLWSEECNKITAIWQ